MSTTYHKKFKGEIEKYNGKWRDRTDYPADEPFVIRFKMLFVIIIQLKLI